MLLTLFSCLQPSFLNEKRVHVPIMCVNHLYPGSKYLLLVGRRPSIHFPFYPFPSHRCVVYMSSLMQRKATIVIVAAIVDASVRIDKYGGMEPAMGAA